MENKIITLKTLPEATAQEVFDQVVAHLMNQGKKSTGDLICRYKNSDGLKCAVGCLIGDNEYDNNWEGKRWYEVVKSGHATYYHNGLIQKLQRVHDNFEIHEWKRELELVAIGFSLEFNLE